MKKNDLYTLSLVIWLLIAYLTTYIWVNPFIEKIRSLPILPNHMMYTETGITRLNVYLVAAPVVIFLLLYTAFCINLARNHKEILKANNHIIVIKKIHFKLFLLYLLWILFLYIGLNLDLGFIYNY